MFKKYFLSICLGIIMIGCVLPFLLSAKDDLLVVVGLLVMALPLFVLAAWTDKQSKKLKGNRNEKSN